MSTWTPGGSDNKLVAKGQGHGDLTKYICWVRSSNKQISNRVKNEYMTSKNTCFSFGAMTKCSIKTQANNSCLIL